VKSLTVVLEYHDRLHVDDDVVVFLLLQPDVRSVDEVLKAFVTAVVQRLWNHVLDSYSHVTVVYTYQWFVA